MNTLPLMVQDQAHNLEFFVISSQEIQLRCICSSWVFIPTCKYKQCGTYLEDTSTAPMNPLTSPVNLEFNTYNLCEESDEIQTVDPWNHRQARSHLSYASSPV